MTLLPLIDRELRTAARQPFTYNVRVLGVLALLVVLAMFGLRGGLGPGIGGKLFGALHAVLFSAIWLLVPMLTADCISRERREGTLPLLFLTPLRPRDIVLAKGLAHGLRAFSLWLAVLPVLTVSFVVGGVGWAEATVSVLINFSSICLALAAGLVASAGTKAWTRAMAAAACLATLFLYCFLKGISLLSLSGFGSSPFASPGSSGMYYWSSGNGVTFGFTRGISFGFAMALNWEGLWQYWLGTATMRSGPGPWLLVRSFAFLALLSFLFVFLLIRFSARKVKRSWQDLPPSARVLWLREKFCRPVLFQDWLRRWLRWQLQRNPIGWLEQRSWRGRLIVWVWFAIVACIYSSLFANWSLYDRGFHTLQALLAQLLAGSMALSAAASFRRERESGALELLLVAPLREWQIIFGRVRGLWFQFLPAVGLLCVGWLCGASLLREGGECRSIFLYLVAFATIPVVGLYFSLAKASFISALLWTMLLQVAVPVAMASVVRFFAAVMGLGASPDELTLGEILVPTGYQLGLALLLGWCLHANLKGRKFAWAGRSS